MTKLTISKVTPAIGADVSGLDLSGPPDQATCDAVYAALIEHQVIFMRDQDLSPEAHLALARSFGDLDGPHPVYPGVPGHEQIVMLKNGPDNPPDTDGWHTDVTFRQNPPFTSILWARQVPDVGGDTLWTSQTAAWDALPEDMKAYLSTLSAVHDMGDFRNNFAVGETRGEKLTAAHQRFGSAIHPVRGTHPVTGKPFLYVNEGFTVQVVGLRARESRQLLADLFEHCNQPEFQVRFKWSNKALVMWDNRCTQHYAVADYLPAERCMHRVTVINDRRAGGRVRAA